MKGRSPLVWLLSGLAVSVGSLLFVFAALELMIRLFMPQTALATNMWKPDPKLGYRLVPEFHGEYGEEKIPLVTNSWGMRDREYGPKQPGIQRVYVLGDSLMFGYGVAIEDAFSRSLENWLKEHGVASVEVVNGGVPGWGTAQQHLFFEETVDTVQPDVVILGLFVGNDILDNLQFARPNLGRVGSWRKQGFRTWFRENSQLYIWLRRQYNERTERWENLERLGVDTHATTPPEKIRRGIELTEEALGRLAESTRRRGIDLLVMLIPRREQVYDDLFRDVLARHALAADAYDARQPNQRLAEETRAQGVAVLDLLEPLSAAASTDRELYFPVHLTPSGNTVAGAAAGRFLLQQGWLGAAANGGS